MQVLYDKYNIDVDFNWKASTGDRVLVASYACAYFAPDSPMVLMHCVYAMGPA